jgi:hypothetical protein
MGHQVQDIIVAGCAPGEPDCNEPPPMDGYIVFWGWTLAAVLVISAIAFVAWRWRRSRRPAPGD